MRLSHLVATLALVLAAAACPEKTAATAPPTTATTTTPPSAPTPAPSGAPDTRIADADRACATDADCALTTVDCCGCNALGSQEGIRKDRVAALATRRAPVCSAIACPQAMSDDPSCSATQALCRKGRCEVDVPTKRSPGPGEAETHPIEGAR